MAPSSHLPRGARLRPLRRPDGSVQLGAGPRSVRLVGLSDAEVRWLAALDPARVSADALAAAALEGIEPARAGEVLDRLIGCSLLSLDAGERCPRVSIVGSGALPALLTDVLRQGEQVQAARVRHGGEDEAADLAVVVSPAPADSATVQPWLGAGTPVVPLWCQPEHASIGPVLTPSGRPCLHCIELTRVDADPDWPHLRAQLSRPRVAGSEPVDGLPAVRLLAAGLTTALVLDHVSGRAVAPEWSLEVATPGPSLERRRWPTHPRCPVCAPAPSVQEASAPADAESERRSRHRRRPGFTAGSGEGDTMAV